MTLDLYQQKPHEMQAIYNDRDSAFKSRSNNINIDEGLYMSIYTLASSVYFDAFCCVEIMQQM